MNETIFDKAAKAVEDTLRWSREESDSIPLEVAKGITRGAILGAILVGTINAAQGWYEIINHYKK